MTFVFRNAGESGHGVGRIRFWVDDMRGRCLGSIEGKTGDYQLDADYNSGKSAPRTAKPYRTRSEAAEALAALNLKNEQPPIGRAEYSMLVYGLVRQRAPIPPVSRGMARLLCGRGLMVEVASEFRTTTAGRAEIKRFDQWESTSKNAAPKPQATE